MAEWWRDAVLYEVYVRSFADADGDGTGDLQGIRQRLPYLADLGVDGLWLTPFYPSPGVDHGYDVSDYCDVDLQFGTLGDFDALLADAHALDLRIVIDLVANHTSTAHPWFREKPEYYVWADEVPNNWRSVWEGPAWEPDPERGRHYLHLFAAEQPDLDWHNPAVRRSSSGSCASGSTAASTASGSTSPTGSSRTRRSPTSPSARTAPRPSTTAPRPTGPRCTRSTAAGARSSTPTRANACSSAR